jgi:hypothetical protein
MDQLTNKGGGDTRTPAAKLAAAQREEQIVALRLRHVPFAAIGRQLGISRIGAYKTFHKAIRANTKEDIQEHHRRAYPIFPPCNCSPCVVVIALLRLAVVNADEPGQTGSLPRNWQNFPVRRGRQRRRFELGRKRYCRIRGIKAIAIIQ